MQVLLQSHQGEQLICYFAGWGTPPSMVEHLILPPNTDLAIAYQYHDLSFPIDFYRYQSVRVIAWSLGVWVAERICHQLPTRYPHLQLSSATAINGTGLPYHNTYGIPCRLFDATLRTLSPQNRLRFEQQMYNNIITLKKFRQATDYRDFQDISRELQYLYQGITSDFRTDLLPWSNAILSTNDAIFPVENMRHYWEKRCVYQEIKAEHLIFPLYTHWEHLWS